VNARSKENCRYRERSDGGRRSQRFTASRCPGDGSLVLRIRRDLGVAVVARQVTTYAQG
jgi:hypothetical protein